MIENQTNFECLSRSPAKSPTISDNILLMSSENLNLSSANQSSKHAYQLQKIYVYPLPKTLNNKELEVLLKDYFKDFGSIIDLIVLKHDSKGLYGYVTFSSDTTVLEVLSRQHKMFGRKLNVDRAWQKVVDSSKKPESTLSKKLFVGGVPHMASKSELIDVFSKYGRVTDLTLPRTDDSKNQGFAFVTFDSIESAVSVMANRSNIYVRAKQLDIKPNMSLRTVEVRSRRKRHNKKAPSLSLTDQLIEIGTHQKITSMKSLEPKDSDNPKRVFLTSMKPRLQSISPSKLEYNQVQQSTNKDSKMSEIL